MTLEGNCGGLTDFGCDQLAIEDEGIALGSASSLNFVGSGVTATIVNGIGTITIPGGGTGSSPLTTKGDLYGFSTLDARIPVGADGTFLTADSSQVLGVKWAPVSGTGDFVGPASSTNNSIVLFNGITGKLGQNSVVIIDPATGNSTGFGTIASADTTITSVTAAAFNVGPNGSTNPALVVNCATASADCGLTITGGTASGNIAATGNDANISVDIAAKGGGTVSLTTGTAGQITLRPNGSTRYSVNSTTHTYTVATSVSTASPRYGWTLAADTGLTGGTEAQGAVFDFSQTRQHASNTTVATQRDFNILGTNHSFATAGGTITNYGTFSISYGNGGTNSTITNNAAFYIPTAAITNTTNGYALKIEAPSGSTNSYAASFTGTAGEILRLRTDAQIAVLATNTATGTTGNQTINRPSGTVNFAAAASSITVTNSLCTAASIIIPVLRTADVTARIANVVPGAGSFVINLTAGATAETSCGFLIIN